MSLGAPRLRQSALAILVLAAACAVMLSCGNNNNFVTPGLPTEADPATIRVHVFVSNPLFSLSTSTTPVLNVVDGQRDLLSPSVVSVGTTNPLPGPMVLFPNKKFTLVLNTSGDTLGVVNNVSQRVAQNSGGTTETVTLPGFSESVVIAPDNATGFAAVPGALVAGQSPGVVDVLSLSTNSISATIPVPGARYLVQSHNGNRILVLGGSPNTITVLTPSAVGTSTDPRLDVQSSLFDHPVWGAFSSDDSTAYILNCGLECGGTAASITLLDVNSNQPGPSIPVDAGTVGLLLNNTLYVAGTKPGTTCVGSTTPTLATTCGEVSTVDLATMTVTATAIITDGYHNQMQMGANNQLFIGARTCTDINVPASGNSPGEVRGCLSILDTGNKASVVIPPARGDVTGIQPISRRSVVYVVQNGELQIYDTTTNKLQKTQVNIVGHAIGVLQAD